MPQAEAVQQLVQHHAVLQAADTYRHQLTSGLDKSEFYFIKKIKMKL